MKEKVVVITGPTASGKSSLGVRLAKSFQGEIISVDSRQVYKGLNIGTDKITKSEMGGIPHHLLDVVEPDERFTVIDFKERSENAIEDIISRGRNPFLVGGTGFYIQAIVDNLSLPNVSKNEKLRSSLNKKPSSELYSLLTLVDPRRAEEIDPNNKNRLIRALEIAAELGEVPKHTSQEPRYQTLQIGLRIPKKVLKERIEKRVGERIEEGMIEEAEQLYENGLSLDRMEELGLTYRYLARYLRRDINKETMSKQIAIKEWQYARRQMAWFRKDERINWYSPDKYEQIEALVEKFLKG